MFTLPSHRLLGWRFSWRHNFDVDRRSKAMAYGHNVKYLSLTDAKLDIRVLGSDRDNGQ